MNLLFFCPIPDDQKPISEYIELKEKSRNNWIISSEKNYWENLLSLFLPLFSVIIFFSFLLQNFIFSIKIFSTSFYFSFFISIFLIGLIIFFQFFRWIELNKRLKKSRIIYEEGSWYDGKIWNKPLSLIKNEKLISFQKIDPLLQRLFLTLIFLFFISLFFFFH